jgi:hypothetical protein
MSIFDIDHLNTVWRLLVPPDKRKPKWLSWGLALLSAQQWKQDTFFTGYMTGAENLPNYVAGPIRFDGPTDIGERVIFRIPTSFHSTYGDNAVYEAIKYEHYITYFPTGTYLAPDISPETANDNSADALAWVGQYVWIKIQDNFIGANERVMYNASRLIFEYALNRWFFTTYRDPAVGVSDIYITPHQRLYDYLYMGPAENGYNYIPPAYNLATPYVPLSSALESLTEFTINVPVAVYNSLSSVSGNRTQIVRNFADRINAAGMVYDVATY